MTSIRVIHTAQLTADEWSKLTDLCVAAFDEPWDGYWDSIGPGVHVLAEEPGHGIVGHAAIVERLLYPGDGTLRTGYVEAVAVAPFRQGRGIGSNVMEVVNGLIDAAYQLGALGTGRSSFYARLGWVIWQGPAWVRLADGRLERAPNEDGAIMVRRTPTTPPGLDLAAPIAVDWRPGEVW